MIETSHQKERNNPISFCASKEWRGTGTGGADRENTISEDKFDPDRTDLPS